MLPSFRKPQLAAYVLVAVVAACDSSQGTSSKELTRAIAKQKIVDLLNLPVEVSVAVPQVVEISTYVAKDVARKDFEDAMNGLSSEGLITLGKPNRPIAGMPIHTMEVGLTEKGKQFLSSKAKVEQGGHKAWVMVGCVVDFNEITGIQHNAPKTEADVHLTVKVSKISPFAVLDRNSLCGHVLHGKGEGRERNLVSQVMKMALFDDGWRVVPR